MVLNRKQLFFIVIAFWYDLHLTLFGLNFVYERIPTTFMLQWYGVTLYATIIFNVRALIVLSEENERIFVFFD